jgi:predicted nuclease of predicted toxin-antitoxin system
MLPLLIDEGLPASIAEALRTVEVDALAIGDVGAPTKGSTDETNVPWCAAQGRLLVTNDRGKKDRVILDLLNQHHVHALFVYNDLRSAAPHHLLRALLRAEDALDQAAGLRGLIAGRLRPTGRIEFRRR